MKTHHPRLGLFFLILVPVALVAQGQRDAVPLKDWQAPLFWQPTVSESQAAANAAGTRSGRLAATLDLPDDITAATLPANALVFVGMTPCRVVDTRTGSGFTGAFGPPSLVGGLSRTFPIPLSTTCAIPSIAQAYSFNVTVVPPGFLDFLTIWPTGQVRPNASTLNGYVATVISNAAVVPAGTSGSVDVYASQNTNLIIDINGYYAPLSALTLSQGTAAAPALSFSGDPGTGIYSSGTGALNVTTGGANRLSVNSSGNVGIGTASPDHRLSLSGGPAWTTNGWTGALSLTNAAAIGWQTNAGGQRFGIGHSGGGLYFFHTTSDPGTATSPADYDMTIADSGNVGIGTTTPTSKVEIAAQDGLKISGYQPFVTVNDTNSGKPAFLQGVNGDAVLLTNTRAALVLKDGSGRVGIGTSTPTAGLDVQVASGYAVIGQSNGGPGVTGYSTNSPAVQGSSNTGTGVTAFSTTNYGLYAVSSSNYAGYFGGSVYVTGTLTQNSDARLKRGISNLSYGLREVMQLRPVTWTWKEKPEQGVQLGLVAQEAETVVPELVSTAKDPEQTKGINYIGLVPVMIKAIQEQQRQIDDLKQLLCLDRADLDVCK